MIIIEKELGRIIVHKRRYVFVEQKKEEKGTFFEDDDKK